MRRLLLTTTAAATIAGSVLLAAPPAQAAHFCASKPGGDGWYRDITYKGKVVATICAPAWNVSGNAYLYARGSYASVEKYMKLEIQTLNKPTVQADGQYRQYVYRGRPAGVHGYRAVMYDGNGTRIVNHYDADTD